MTVDVNGLMDKVLTMLDEATAEIGYDPELITIIPSGIDVLDLYIGGIPIGAPIVFVGNPGSGKSTLAASILANLEKKYPTFFAGYVDNEYSMSKERLALIGASRVLLKSGLTLEQIHTFLDQMAAIKQKQKLTDPAILVWDTYANTMTEKELTVEDPAKATGWRVRVLGHRLIKMINTAIKHQIGLIIINQLRDLISMDGYVTPAKELKHFRYGKDMPGGNPLKFNAFTLIDLKDAGLVPETYGFPGSFVEVTVVKCKKLPSGTRFKLVLDQSKGFDNLYSKFEFLVGRKAILSAGGVRKLKNDTTKSFYVKQLKEKYEKDEAFRKAFDDLYEQEAAAVRRALGQMVVQLGKDTVDTNTGEVLNEQTQGDSNVENIGQELSDLVSSTTPS